VIICRDNNLKCDKVNYDNISKILYKLFLSRATPKYFPFLYWFCKSYVALYQGDGDANRETNGGWKFLEDYIETKHPKLIFDVGAYDGEYLHKIHEFDSNIEIYAFEPNPESFKKLNEKKIRNVVCIQSAMSDFEGSAVLYTTKDAGATDSLHMRNKGRHKHDGEYNVNCTTVDKYCEDNDIKYIDMLKIDTEGNDLSVIKGARRMLDEDRIGIVQFEFGTLNTFSNTYINDFYNYLTQFGLELYKIKHYGLEKVERPELERTTYSYFVGGKIKNINGLKII